MSVRFVTMLFGLSSVVFLTLITIAVLYGIPCFWYLITMGSINAFISYYLGVHAGLRAGAKKQVEERIATIENELATRRSKRAHSQATY